MNKQTILTLGALFTFIIGAIMIYLGALKGDKIILPPLLSGIAFWVIAWVFNGIRK
ncbi:MAG: hypothetical protein KKC03_01290 [Bacteroidetes bacterium]|nr:hypothetical protein [Bacteroidota bacterium]